MEVTFYWGGGGVYTHTNKERHVSKYVVWYLAISAKEKNKSGGGIWCMSVGLQF